MRQAAGRRAPHAMAAISFAESSFFPIPPDVILAPMILARPDRAYTYATICTIASVLGGVLGYAIGLFFEPVANQIFNFFHLHEKYEDFQQLFAQYGLWVILVKGLTPIPYKLVTIASGLAQFNFAVFIAASVVTRGGRFFLTAWLLKRFGPRVREIVERRLILATTLAVLLLVLGVAALKLL
jgi:membrane protein YqaA with SNARE-associated domain